MRRPTVRCPECGRVVSGRVPRGGDGTALYPHRHHRAQPAEDVTPGGPCPGSFRLVRPTRAMAEAAVFARHVARDVLEHAIDEGHIDDRPEEA